MQQQSSSNSRVAVNAFDQLLRQRQASHGDLGKGSKHPQLSTGHKKMNESGNDLTTLQMLALSARNVAHPKSTFVGTPPLWERAAAMPSEITLPPSETRSPNKSTPQPVRTEVNSAAQTQTANKPQSKPLREHDRLKPAVTPRVDAPVRTSPSGASQADQGSRQFVQPTAPLNAHSFIMAAAAPPGVPAITEQHRPATPSSPVSQKASAGDRPTAPITSGTQVESGRSGLPNPEAPRPATAPLPQARPLQALLPQRPRPEITASGQAKPEVANQSRPTATKSSLSISNFVPSNQPAWQPVVEGPSKKQSFSPQVPGLGSLSLFNFSQIGDPGKFLAADTNVDQNFAPDGSKSITYTASDFSACKLQSNLDGSMGMTLVDKHGRPQIVEEISYQGERTISKLTYHDENGRPSPWIKTRETVDRQGAIAVISYDKFGKVVGMTAT